MTPTARSMANLRKRGFSVDTVERNLRMMGRTIKKDAFGFGDLLAFHPLEGIFLVQATITSEMPRRELKIRGKVYRPTEKETKRQKQLRIKTGEYARAWKIANGKILLHGWAKRGPCGKRKLWTLTEKML